ncbi:hypothetical protein NPA11_02005 [Mycoplasma sp. 1578d]|uniref:hypothetical protein n=1 Tax=Mycoplasma sp. 1578d TaxID=2967299 RepID=UPI00211BCF5F|nr:hypothetical protein [Mycoplasma sp. 1578d]UUM19535.1 hypothetical protein NPA11_02005 [Mycoplasma sp. 1578d]
MSKKKTAIGIGKVIKITDSFIKISAKNGDIFTIHAKQISDKPNVKIKNIFKINDVVNFYINSYDTKTKKGIGSFMINHPNFCADPFQFKLDETKNGFANLLALTLKDINGNT